MDYDIAIVGAGPAGMSLACSLRDSGLKIVVLEKLSANELANPPVDGRDIALTHLSRRLMQHHGSWQRIDPEQISMIQKAEVIDGDSPYTLDFETPADDTDALGFIISNYRIRKAIFEEFNNLDNVTLIDNTLVKHVSTNDAAGTVLLDDGQKLKVNLIVAADTRFSQARHQMGISASSYDYGRSAVLCWMDHEISHEQTAFECFHYGRTLAILPLAGNRSSAVITTPTQQVNEILNMSEEAFSTDIEQRLGGRLGKMTQIGERFTYPLVGVHANSFQAGRFALIGDAAVGMHPVTAHGFNLGLSGQDLLSNGIIKAHEQGYDYWSPRVLQRYQQQHMLSTRPLYHGTNTVVNLFTNDSFPATMVRKAVLRLSNNLPPVKWAITQKLMSKEHIKFTLPGF